MSKQQHVVKCRVCEQTVAHNQHKGMCIDCYIEMSRYKIIQLGMLREDLLKESLDNE
jgi:Zn finger protein HypA/HybF involved in hydrogenase expression